MSGEAENEVEVGENGSGSYGEFLEELAANGVTADGDKIAREGIGLIQPPEAKHTNAALVASVPNASSIYEKKEKIKGVLLDLMNRTCFHNRAELINFNEWLNYCEDYGVSYDEALRYVVGINSEGGLARQQYVDAITTMRFRNYGGNNAKGSQFKPKHREGELT